MKPVFEASIRALPIVGSSRTYPVRRVYCIGRNYTEHAIEMNADPTREPPFYFMKPCDAVAPPAEGSTLLELPYPKCTEDVHHEGELVVCLGPGASSEVCERTKDDEELLRQCVFGYALGIDLTKRDVQAKVGGHQQQQHLLSPQHPEWRWHTNRWLHYLCVIS
ncbi:Palmitoyltransferase zdhhc15, variant 2 [Perkinsus olseni]|uniref:Palmitoyltransferase zdhhc15, variant 2 n=1 Tax=Perkinsus olseni TaxID=32597 RepID=A0A7J6QY59_PEROL|nr:Palmitoyltransferase zdhhc15, variant 2 [Perkinsus olseni]